MQELPPFSSYFNHQSVYSVFLHLNLSVSVIYTNIIQYKFLYIFFCSILCLSFIRVTICSCPLYSLLYCISLYKYTTVYLFTPVGGHLAIYEECCHELLCTPFGEHMYSFLLSTHLGVESLAHLVCICSALKNTAK